MLNNTLTDTELVAYAQAAQDAAQSHMNEHIAKGDTAMDRYFLSGDEIAKFEAEVPGEQAEAVAKQETEFTNAVFLRDNKGRVNLRDYLKGGLIRRRGYLAVFWEGPKLGDCIQMTGVTADMLQEMLSDEMVQVTKADPSDADPNVYDVEYKAVELDGCIKIEAPSMRDVLIAKGFDSEDEADYVALKREVSRSDLIKMFPEKLEMIKTLSGTGYEDDDIGSETYQSERPDQLSEISAGFAKSNDRFLLLDEYFRLDVDGDGISKLINLKRIGREILEQRPVDMQPLCSWTSAPEDDHYFASSLAEETMQSQLLRTTAMRQAIDSVRLSTTPRVMAGDGVNINALLDQTPGAVVPVENGQNRSTSDSVKVLTIPDVSGPALQLSEAEEREREFVTGINRQSQGLDPDSLTDTFGGMQLLQNSASARKEYLAREASEGLERCFEKISHLLRRHHNYERQLKSQTNWITVKPTSWLDRTSVDIDIGVGTGSREAALGQIQIMADAQERMIAAGMKTVSEQNAYNLSKRMVEAVGYTNPEEFFTDPSQLEQQQPEGPTPEEQAAQMDVQFKEREMAMKERESQQKMQLAEREMVNRAEMERMRAEFEAQMAKQKANNEAQLALIKANSAQIPSFRPGGRLDA